MARRRLPAAATSLLVALTASWTDACLAGYPGCLCDPVVTHTNGMRLASTEAQRSHNVYWRCDPGHIGYCDGRMYGPFQNDWRSLGTRRWGKFQPPITPHGPTGNNVVGACEGIEEAGSATLGSLAAVGPDGASRPAGVAAAPAALPLPLPAAAGGALPPAPEGDNWLDAIQTLGRKMIATPEG